MTRRFHAWERPAGDCSGGPRPGALALLAAILNVFGGDGAHSLGIYNCRTVRGSTSPSVHGEGRAVDIGLPMDGWRADGHAVVDRILAKALELGLCYAVYDRVDFNRSHPYGDTYGGAHPHRDHVHLELTRYAAERLNYTTARALLDDRSQIVTLKQAVVVPSAAQQANEWDRPLGAAIATGYGVALVGSDSSGEMRTIWSSAAPPGTLVKVTDWAEVVGGETKYNGDAPAHRIAGGDRYRTAQEVFKFIRAHDPADWEPRGRPY